LLEHKQVRGGAIVVFAPDAEAVGGLDKAHRHPHSSAGAAHASLHEVAHTQHPAHGHEVVGHGVAQTTRGMAAGALDLESLDAPEAGRDLLREPIGQVCIGRVGRQVVEVQHRDTVRRHLGRAPGVSVSRAARRWGAVGALGGGGMRERWNEGKNRRNDSDRAACRGHFPSFRHSVLQSSLHLTSATSAWNRGSLRSGSYIQWCRNRAAWKRRCQGTTRPTQAMALSVWPSWAYAPARYTASVRDSPLGVRCSLTRKLRASESVSPRALAVSPFCKRAMADNARLGAGTSPNSRARCVAARAAAHRPSRRSASAAWRNSAGKAESIESPCDAAARASKGRPPMLRNSATPA